MMANPQNTFEKLVNVYAVEVQAVETALAQVLLTAHTDAGDPLVVGTQLDGIGQIIGLAREGISDTFYRARLLARILVNKSNGTPPEIIEIVTAFLNDLSPFVYISEDDTGEAGFEVEVTDPIPVGLGVELGLVVREAKVAGVIAYAIYQESADNATFAFDGANGAQFDSGGFGFRGARG